MEQNQLLISRKFSDIVRAMLFVLRKGRLKGKLMAELNVIIKRGKIAGKAIQNLMLHHWSAASTTTRRCLYEHDTPKEYEFSCSNSPVYPNFHVNKWNRKHSHHANLFPPTHLPEEEDDIVTLSAVMRTLEMINSGPISPGLGKSPNLW